MSTRTRKRRIPLLTAVMTVAVLVATATTAVAHESQNDGHIPANTNYGFEVIGRDTLAGVEDGLYTDVWSHNGFAYVGTFQEPECSDAGVFVVDIEAAIAQYANDGSTEGATVAEIRSAPNTRINDVKVHTVGDTDVLITTQEPCGSLIPGGPISDANRNENGNGPKAQVGQGGISLYDVSDPTKPKALKKNFLEYEGVHNTFAWDWNGSSYLIGTADTFDFFDTFFVDITKPQSPKLLTITGGLDWFAAGAFSDGQFETGSSAGIFNHDVWVEIIDGVPTAVVSYWDGGFVTLDVTDPANPIFLRDSTYPSTEPIVGEPYEGNAHAAVFGGNGDYLFAGDEDFSPDSFAITVGGVNYPAGIALYGDDPNTLTGDLVVTNSEGCTAADLPPATADGQVAMISRGSCFFSDKGASAQTQGYAGYIVVNNDGDDLINMSPGDNALPDIPGVFIGQSDGLAIIEQLPNSVSASSIFDGWGYLHVINNTESTITVPSMGAMNPATMDVDPGYELGYYAPAEAVEEGLGTSAGDLTMHNIEADPLTQGVEPSFDAGPRMFVSWYSLGMRALEYRPGHFHDNSRGEGSYSQNVHEVGRFIAEDGSNFWGVHVDENEAGEQIILASDRNTGLWIFTFSCVTRIDIGDGEQDIFYCDPTQIGG